MLRECTVISTIMQSPKYYRKCARFLVGTMTKKIDLYRPKKGECVGKTNPAF